MATVNHHLQIDQSLQVKDHLKRGDMEIGHHIGADKRHWDHLSKPLAELLRPPEPPRSWNERRAPSAGVGENHARLGEVLVVLVNENLPRRDTT